MMSENNAIMIKKVIILVIILFSLLSPLSAESNTKKPVYFIDDDIDYFSNMIYQDDQIFALGSRLGELYFYSFSQDLHLKYKKVFCNQISNTSMMPYKDGFFIKSANNLTSKIFYINKKGKLINSLNIKGSIKDCYINDDEILLITSWSKQLCLNSINDEFELDSEILLPDVDEIRYSNELKFMFTDKYNYLLGHTYSNVLIYTYTKEWDFINKKILAEFDGKCGYKLDIWNDQIVIYPEEAAWITNPRSYTDYKGKAHVDQIKYFDTSGTLLRSVDIPRYHRFSFKPVLEEDIYIEQSEDLKKIYLVSSMGDKVREIDFDFAFTMKDHTSLPDDKFLFAGEYAQCKFWKNHGFLMINHSPHESLSLFPITEDALILDTAFKANDDEKLSELVEKWYLSGDKAKKIFWRKWEKEAYALYQVLLPIIYERNTPISFAQVDSLNEKPIYQLIPNNLTVAISDSIYVVKSSFPYIGLMSTAIWEYSPIKSRHKITDFRPKTEDLPKDFEFIYSTDKISHTLYDYFALSKEVKSNRDRNNFLNKHLRINIQNGLGYQPYIYGYFDYTTIIFDSSYKKAIVLSDHLRKFHYIKESGVWRKCQ